MVVTERDPSLLPPPPYRFSGSMFGSRDVQKVVKVGITGTSGTRPERLLSEKCPSRTDLRLDTSETQSASLIVRRRYGPSQPDPSVSRTDRSPRLLPYYLRGGDKTGKECRRDRWGRRTQTGRVGKRLLAQNRETETSGTRVVTFVVLQGVVRSTR